MSSQKPISRNQPVSTPLTSYQPYNKPQFMDPPDQSSTKIQNIMSTLYQKQQQIMAVLSKYKNQLPNDQQQQLNQQQPIKNKRELPEYQIRSSSNNKSTKAKSVNKKQKNNKTLDFDNNPYNRSALRDNSKVISLKQSLQKYKNRAKGSFKLPTIERNRDSNKRQQFELLHEKADKMYNHNVIEFYQSLSNRKSDPDANHVEVNKSRIEKHNSKRKQTKDFQKQIETLPIRIQPRKNIFDHLDTPQQMDLLLKQEIMQPIAYHPYSQISANQKSGPQNKNASRAVSINDEQDDDKPTEVPMSYYIRTFNQKLKQQSKEQINYLYFSKSDENQSSKEWASQIISMFQKHNSQLVKMHQSMKYLQTFDEGFFTAGIYQTTQGNRN